MKKTLLCIALLTALSACDNNNSSQSKIHEPIPQIMSKTLTGAEQAEATETRFKDLNARGNKQISTFISAGHRGIKTFEVSLNDYQRGEQSSSAKSTLTLALSPELAQYYDEIFEEPLVVTLDTKIDHSDELGKEGIVAKAISTIVFDEALKNRFELDEKESAAIQNFLEKFQIDTTFFANDEVEQNFIIQPIHIEGEDKGVLHYDGFNIANKFKQSDLNDNLIYPSNLKLNSGKLSLVDNDSKITLDPIQGSGESKANGDVNFKTTAIHFHDAKNDRTVHVDQVEYQGDKLSFDSDIGNFLGRQHYRLNNISIDGIEDHKIEIKQVASAGKIEKNGALYDLTGSLHTELTTDLVQVFAGIPELKINTIDFNGDFKKVSQKTLQDIQVIGNNPDIIEGEFVENLFKDLLANQSSLHFALAADTQAGKAHAKADVKLVGAPEGLDLSDAPDEEIMKYLDIEAEARIPETILQKIGIAGLVEMQGGDFIKKENGEYVLIFTLKKGTAILNDQKLPL